MKTCSKNAIRILLCAALTLCALCGCAKKEAEADLRTADLSGGAESFLLSGGMRPEQIEALKTKLCAAA